MAKIFGRVEGLNLELARRLQSFADDVGLDLRINSGYRSLEKQQELYDLYLAGKGNLAAKPGRSFHNYHGAADCKFINGHYPQRYQRKLAKHGLYLAVPSEPWHLQMIGWSKSKCALGPFVVGGRYPMGPSSETAKLVQRQLTDLGFYDDAIDGIWGPNSQAGMRNLRATFNRHNSPSIVINDIVDADSAKAMKWAFDNIELMPNYTAPIPEPVPTETAEQAVIALPGTFEESLAKALGSLYNWKYIPFGTPHDVVHAIVIGPAPFSKINAKTKTVLGGRTSAQIALAVYKFVASVPPGSESRRGNPKHSVRYGSAVTSGSITANAVTSATISANAVASAPSEGSEPTEEEWKNYYQGDKGAE